MIICLTSFFFFFAEILKEILTKHEMILDTQKRMMVYLQSALQAIPQDVGHLCKNKIPFQTVEDVQSFEAELAKGDGALKSDLVNICFLSSE